MMRPEVTIVRTPEMVVEALGREAPGPDWLRDVARALLRDLAPLARIVDAWGLSQSQAAGIFGVSRQALSKWMHQGVPADREPVVATLAAATDLMLTHLKPDRIAAVVRRPAPALGSSSLLDLARTGDMQAVYDRVADMFDLGRLVP
jgi:hypothetical protein